MILVCLFLSINNNQDTSAFLNNIEKQNLINSYIIEVFQEQSQKLVFDNKNRFSLLKDFISRTSIKAISDINTTKYPNLLEISLQNKYNKNLTYDKSYTSNQYFNPLKYDLPMFPNTIKYYKIGNSNFVLAIKPSNN